MAVGHLAAGNARVGVVAWSRKKKSAKFIYIDVDTSNSVFSTVYTR